MWRDRGAGRHLLDKGWRLGAAHHLGYVPRMLEVELEDLIYEQPWLLSPELLPLEHILGDGGLPGRQVRLKGGQYRPDLLFKTRTGRPRKASKT